ncbi:transcription termination/antitermination NusG family protein [Xanthobacteraceae bacterium Astr-EGSB]|uniref:transcription termination/antitermination protein NusG n=1 Tax=Astrobacterium formosum TaxID=3069710 RepID=UPI0027AE64F2|nr:transcription termination/antitermination NusG family protein [Xanthobacteraceae bacterium Astr-EGSB]
MTKIEHSLSTMVEPAAVIDVPIGRRWRVAHTEAGWERRAELGIAALGLPCYGPRERVWVRHARRRERRDRALFRRYVFVAFDLDRDDWGAVLSVKGVTGLLCCDPRVPSCVPDAEINALRRAEQAGVFDTTVDGLTFRAGDAVQVEAGPFSGFIGEVRRADSKARVDILLASLGTVVLPVELVAKIELHESSAARGVGR